MTLTRKRKIWYFGLEPLKERYTYQLSEHWMPDAFKEYDHVEFVAVPGKKVSDNISVGSVLDATARGIYSLTQCETFLSFIRHGLVKDDDVIFLQDFWTPGIESIMYALHLHKVQVKVYSMLHAQSVDEYDFTYDMKNWMRPIELGYDKYHSGIFVASTIHKEQLRAAGFNAPIHVVGLPINCDEFVGKDTNKAVSNQVIYTSRLDKEKNPYFMLAVAQNFLAEHPNYTWVVTTSGEKFKSGLPNFILEMEDFARKEKRFKLRKNLTKEQYYQLLRASKVQFNSSLQDYVSWTLLEAVLCGCDIAYPNFRSFPEIIKSDRLYRPGSVASALDVIDEALAAPNQHKHIAKMCDVGRRLEAAIIVNDETAEINIWNEYQYAKTLIS
jgi:glycosyltransferase involved in cell wall biosynthesis